MKLGKEMLPRSVGREKCERKYCQFSRESVGVWGRVGGGERVFRGVGATVRRKKRMGVKAAFVFWAGAKRNSVRSCLVRLGLRDVWAKILLRVYSKCFWGLKEVSLGDDWRMASKVKRRIWLMDKVYVTVFQWVG